MTSSNRTNNFLRPIRSTPIISGAAGQVSCQQQLQHDLWNFRESSVSSREGTPSSLRGVPTFDELPDRAISSRKLCQQKTSIPLSQASVDAIKEAAYVGSFPVDEVTQEARAEYIKKHLTEKLNVKIAKPVLLAISLSGIKVCCGSGETVYMAHALKRISYATCQPEKCQFSFLAREPRAPTSIQYCHTFLTRSSSEAEELNNIVANAFKTAYLQQQQQSHPSSSENSHGPSLSFNDLIQSQIDKQNQEFNLANERKQEQLRNQLNRISTPRIDSIVQQRKERRTSNKKNGGDEDSGKEEGCREEAVLAWARNVVEGLMSSTNKSHSRRALANFSSSNDRISSLTEISDLCGMSDDLSIIDDFLCGLSIQNGSPVSALKEFVERNFVTLFGGELAPVTSTMTLTLPPLHCRLAMPEDLSPLDMDEQQQPSLTSFNVAEDKKFDFSSTQMASSFEPQRRYDKDDEDGDDELEREDEDLKEKNQVSRERVVFPSSNNIENLSREYFSKNGRAEDLSDANLNEASWYQPGVPRDVALNRLLHQVNGTFVVRDSSTHPGCYALSIKVPKYDSPNEITHYLIVKTQRDTFKIKGLTKEWSSLTSLVLHHTIMRELLPCLLVIPSNK